MNRTFLILLLLAGLREATAENICLPVSSPVSFTKIETVLNGCQISKIEDLLPLLPAEFRSRYVLVYASRSLQYASVQKPRAIVFGRDAKFILAFSNDRDGYGYDLLETIEFDQENRKFVFRTITFPAEQKQNSNSSPPFVSEKNPRLCASCHTSSLRPNWDTYSAWPGLYGSNNDSMPAAEKKHYEAFMRDQFGRTNRYRFLEDPSKYPDRSGFIDYTALGRPNLQFTYLISLLNSQKIAREMKETRQLNPYRYALVAAANCPDDFSDPVVLRRFIPDSHSLPSVSYPEISRNVSHGVLESYREREERQKKLLKQLDLSSPNSPWEIEFKPKEAGYTTSTSRIQYIMKVAGVPFPMEWSTEFGARHPVFYAGPIGQMGELGLFLWQELLDPEQDADLYQSYLGAWNQRSEFQVMKFSRGITDVCKALSEKSLNTLRNSDRLVSN